MYNVNSYLISPNRVCCHFMTHVPISVDKGIIGIRLGKEVRCTDGTTVWICVSSIEKDSIELLFSNGSKSIVEGQIDNLKKIVQLIV